MSLPIGVIEPFQWADLPIPAHGDENAKMARVDAAVTEAMREYGIVGCSLTVCQGDQVIHSRGFGYAELPDKPFLTTTASRCASLSKPLTALCALFLMDSGKLNLDELVLPILKTTGLSPTPVDERVRQITVRQLMDHTTGVPQRATYTSWQPDRHVTQILGQAPTARDVVVDALTTFPLDSDPGTKYQYANANFVTLARVVEARSGLAFNDYLIKVAMPAFDVPQGAIFVSRDQVSPSDSARGPNEAAYYQTSEGRYGSFLPEDIEKGPVFGEAYRGFSTECTDGGGGIAVSAEGKARVLANLHSTRCALSAAAMKEIATRPSHYAADAERFYSKGFLVRPDSRGPWLSHAGMTNHCGGMLGEAAGYQFVAVSNWNNAEAPYVDVILNRAISEALAKL